MLHALYKNTQHDRAAICNGFPEEDLLYLVVFNHPLASQDLLYHVKITKLINDDKIKVQSYLNMMLRSAETKLEEGNLTVKTKMELPAEVTKQLDQKIKKLMPKVKKIEYKH